MKYHLFKASRVYYGRPYCGPSSDGRPAIAFSEEEAFKLYQYMMQNPVGWNIYNADTAEDLTRQIVSKHMAELKLARKLCCVHTACPAEWNQPCLCHGKYLQDFKAEWNLETK